MNISINIRQLITRSIFLVAGLVSATSAHADIVFGAATTLSADTDVSISGNLVYAYAFAPAQATVTVHTVPFVSGQDLRLAETLNARNFSLAGDVINTSFNQIDNTVFNGNDAPPAGSTNASLSAEYQSLVAGAAFVSAAPDQKQGVPGAPCEVTLGNLTPGDDYQVQLFLHDARNISSARIATVISGANSVTLAYNSNDPIPGGADANNNGGVGQFVIGTFTATGQSETFTLSIPDGQGGLQLNAIQVRNVSQTVLLGDVNRDGFVNFFDIAPFIDLLAEGRYQVEADINMCGVVDFFQILPFIDLLSSQN